MVTAVIETAMVMWGLIHTVPPPLIALMTIPRLTPEPARIVAIPSITIVMDTRIATIGTAMAPQLAASDWGQAASRTPTAAVENVAN